MGSSTTLRLGQDRAVLVLGTRTSEGLGPFVQGQTAPIWTITVQTANGTALNITGATITGVFYERAQHARKTLGGTYTITAATSGIFTYAPASANVDTPGVWEAEFKIVTAAGDHYVRTTVPILPLYAA